MGFLRRPRFQLEDIGVPLAWFSSCPENQESICTDEKPFQFSTELSKHFLISAPTPSSYGKKIITKVLFKGVSFLFLLFLQLDNSPPGKGSWDKLEFCLLGVTSPTLTLCCSVRSSSQPALNSILIHQTYWLFGFPRTQMVFNEAGPKEVTPGNSGKTCLDQHLKEEMVVSKLLETELPAVLLQKLHNLTTHPPPFFSTCLSSLPCFCANSGYTEEPTEHS